MNSQTYDIDVYNIMSCSIFGGNNGTNPTSYHHSSLHWLWHPWLPNHLMGDHGYSTTRTLVTQTLISTEPRFDLTTRGWTNHAESCQTTLTTHIFSIYDLSCNNAYFGCLFHKRFHYPVPAVAIHHYGNPYNGFFQLIWGECCATWCGTRWSRIVHNWPQLLWLWTRCFSTLSGYPVCVYLFLPRWRTTWVEVYGSVLFTLWGHSKASSWVWGNGCI